MTVLRDPSTWATEIRIRRSSGPFHRNQITRHSGCRGEFCIRGPPVLNGYYKLPENHIIEAFDRPGFLFRFSHPRNIVAVNDDVTHIPALTTQSGITQDFTSIILYHCWGYEKRKEKRLCAFIAAPSVSEGTQCRNLYGDWEQLNTCSEELVVEACTRDDSDGAGDLTCLNLLWLTQDLLRKVEDEAVEILEPPTPPTPSGYCSMLL